MMSHSGEGCVCMRASYMQCVHKATASEKLSLQPLTDVPKLRDGLVPGNRPGWRGAWDLRLSRPGGLLAFVTNNVHQPWLL